MSRGIALVLDEVHDGEVELESELHRVAQRHHAEHEIVHVAAILARWSLHNRQDLAPAAERYGKELTQHQDPVGPSPAVEVLREKSAEVPGRGKEGGLLLLRDLRQLYLQAQGNAVLWTMLGQGAQATRDSELLEVVTQCQARTLRQATWCNATLKTISPQVLTAAR
ncbi:MAG TPA: hypothetical protein VHU88_18285 [Sporichthyaceae bacterium]|nr:hypothetical protein [Sporichthyaceae bacterium]